MSTKVHALYQTAKPRIETYLERILEIQARDGLAMLTPKGPHEKTRFKHRHNSLKKKGGSPPVDYDVAELIADLADAVKNDKAREAIIIYVRLSRLLPL